MGTRDGDISSHDNGILRNIINIRNFSPELPLAPGLFTQNEMAVQTLMIERTSLSLPKPKI